MTAWRGRYRIWGSGDFTHYGETTIRNARRKSVGFFLDLGRHVVPFVTPDDPWPSSRRSGPFPPAPGLIKGRRAPLRPNWR